MSKRQNQHLFSMIPQTNIQRSKFNRSHGYKTTFDAGLLIPFFVDEVLPGDTGILKTSLFTRIATLISPIMDNVYIDTHYFFVPNRLVWEHWQAFCGEQKNPDDSTDYLIPTITAPSGGFPVGSIFDYFGLPTGVAGFEANALPFRAYNLIWNEWFRDENLQDSVDVPEGDSDNASNYTLLRRGKRHDYFTSCLPFPQKGPGVEIALGGNIPVLSNGKTFGINYSSSTVFDEGMNSYYTLPAGKIGVSAPYNKNTPGTFTTSLKSTTSNSGSANTANIYNFSFSDGFNALYADGSGLTAITINALREAFQVQKWYERAARGGTRYTEILRSFFGVISPDARLQRPEYLGGSSTRLDVAQVAQTSSSDDNTTPQANLSAFGLSSTTNHGFSKSFVEHGYIIGVVSVRADLTYQQGLNRMWSRQTKFDFYWPQFAHLGEQAVLNKEIYTQGTDVDDEVFGYQERYAEYRYFPSMITGKFRSTFAQPLDNWHLAEKFGNLPKLNSTFIQSNPPIDRIIAVQDEPQFLLDAYFDYKCVRPMPLYGVPGLVDHF